VFVLCEGLCARCEQTQNAQFIRISPHIWDRQKALVSSKTIIELYWDGEVEIKEKQREMGIKYLPPT
jgi:hypothetical protein